jgi:hypothetical protein
MIEPMALARKWKAGILVWAATLAYFAMGALAPRDADLFLVVLYWVILAAVCLFTLGLWVRDRWRGTPRATYHMSAYPDWFVRFALDERGPKRGRR